MDIDEACPATMEPREWARLVKRTSADELLRVMQGERRSVILNEVIEGMPAVFRPEVAGALRAVVHWSIVGRPGGGADVFELVISNGVCELSAEPHLSPTLTLTIGPVDFLRLVTGNASPGLLVMRGRLRARGDFALTAKFPKLFDNPKP